MIDFTGDERELAEGLLDDEKVEGLNRAIQIATDLLAELTIEKSIYEKAEQDALDRLDALLQAKAAALDLMDPGNPHTVKYLPEHPQNGGEDPTAWEIFHIEDDGGEPPMDIEVVDYSHTVNWDNDPTILRVEADLLLWVQWLTDPLYGMAKRITGVTGAINHGQVQVAAMEARNEALEVLLG